MTYANIEITTNCDSHDFNPNYKAMIVTLKDLKTNYRMPEFHWRFKTIGQDIVLEHADLMPTDEWLLDIVKVLWGQSPTFKQKLGEFLMERL